MLSASLEQASVERSQQSRVVNHMTKELKETDHFLQVIVKGYHNTDSLFSLSRQYQVSIPTGVVETKIPLQH